MDENKELKNIQLDILKVIVETLAPHKIKFFLIAGSCIGAVRHGGIIPWDDDIDIGLLRDEYEKAREILINELPEGYTWCDHFTEKEYPYNFGKVKRDNTAFVHGGDAHLNIHHGIYVDVFPHDYIDSIEQFESIKNKTRSLRIKIDLKCMSYKKYGKLRPLWQLPIIAFAHIFVNKSKVQIQLDNLVKNLASKDSEYICNFFGVYDSREVCKKEWFGEGINVDFDGVSSLIPTDYDSYLTHLYGDYMTPPPEEKRVSHHDAVFISTTDKYNKLK